MDIPGKHIFLYINHLFSTPDSDNRVYSNHFIGGRLNHIPIDSYGILVNDEGTFLVSTSNDTFCILCRANSDMPMNKFIPEIPFLLGINPTFIIRSE